MQGNMAMPNSHSKTLYERFMQEKQETEVKFDRIVAGQALASALQYLQKRLDWSGTKIATILNLAPATVNNWLSNGNVPIGAKSVETLSPDIQAVVHLLAIHRALETIFNNQTHQIAWLTTFNPYIDSIPEILMGESVEGLICIRHYLEDAAERGA